MNFFRKSVAATVCLVTMLGSVDVASAQTIDLFRAATPVEQAAARDRKPGGAEKRSRVVSLNADAVAPKAMSAATEAFSAPGLRIALFPGLVATVRRTEVDPEDGGLVWNGEGEDVSATLVVDAGRITGLVTFKGKSYRIAPAGGRAHRIVEIDPTRLPPDGPLRPTPKTPAGKKSDAAPAAASAKSKIRVLIAYTQAAEDASPDIAAETKLAVALANKAYKAGGVKIKLTLSGTILVSGFSDSQGFDAALDGVTAGTGPFADVAARRETDKADLVVLLITNPDYCGLGWYVEEPTASDSASGFSVVARDCVAYHSVAHEIGHNMGLAHDRYVVGKAPKSRYNFGFVNAKKRKRDIMSYNNKCSDAGWTCERINRFSDPTITVRKEPFGVKPGKAGAADAARRLNETRAAIAAYR